MVCFAWFFNPTFTTQLLGVIWALGWSMIFLAGFIHLPKWLTLTLCLVMVFGHNLLDGVQVTSSTAASFGWSVLHQFNFFQFGPFNVLAAYPLIPWIGVMALGYCLGGIYNKDSDAQKKKTLLIIIGCSISPVIYCTPLCQCIWRPFQMDRATVRAVHFSFVFKSEQISAITFIPAGDHWSRSDLPGTERKFKQWNCT